MPAPIDLTGHTYGRLTVLNEVLPQQRPRLWRCQCSCGNTKDIGGPSLRKGNTTSCGCYNKELITTHGDTGTRLFYCWQGMLQRCYNKKAKAYRDYGAIGVTVCEEWRTSYVAFKTWAMSSGYLDTLTIDRIDCAPIYSPTTCRWADKVIQSRNQRIRSNTSCEFVGVTFLHKTKRYQASICVNDRRIHLGTFCTAHTAAQTRDNYIKDHALEGYTLNFK